MGFLDFQSNPLSINLLLLAAGAAVVWIAGTRLSGYAARISEHTGLGAAFIGVLLLGGVTSLPEIATTLTASISNNADLAVNNILGGVAMQVTILAIADAVVGGRALSSVLRNSVIVLQGVLLLFVLGLTAAAITAGSVAVMGMDVWTLGIFLVVLGGLYLIKRHEADPRWLPDDEQAFRERIEDEEEQKSGNGADEGPSEEGQSLRALMAKTALVSFTILVAGFVVARAGDAVAEQSGLGAGFVGATLVAIATSLPEVSTTLQSARLGQNRMAFSNIFGTNLFDVALLFLADVAYREGPVLDQLGAFSTFGALLGILLTATFLAGILQRRGNTVLRMGYDSLLVLLLYLGGVIVLYGLR